MVYVTAVTAVYLIFLSLSMSTKNMQSFLLFKFTPAVLGLALIFDALMQLGFIVRV